MKILLFIDDNEFENFYAKIKTKYYSANKKFINYFEKSFLINRPFNDGQWNYSNYLQNDNDTKKYFFINNVSESINRTINGFFKYTKKNFIVFENCIKKIIDIYEKHDDYIEKDISITRILA